MRTIADLQGAEFLREINRLRHKAAAYHAKTHVLDIRQTRPDLTGSETKQERKEANQRQSLINLSRMYDRMLEDYPEETLDLIKSAVFLDDGEELDGFGVIEAGKKLLNTPKVLDFFLSAAQWEQIATEL